MRERSAAYEDDVLTDGQINAVILAVLAGSDVPVAEAEIERAIDWAREVVVSHAGLSLIEQGRLSIRWVDGDWQWGNRDAC